MAARTPASEPRRSPTYRLTDDQLALRDACASWPIDRIRPPRRRDRSYGPNSHGYQGPPRQPRHPQPPVPEVYGGLGGELLTVCLAIEQISRVCATSGLILAVQELASLPLLLAGTDEQKQRWFPDLARVARSLRSP